MEVITIRFPTPKLIKDIPHLEYKELLKTPVATEILPIDSIRRISMNNLPFPGYFSVDGVIAFPKNDMVKLISDLGEVIGSYQTEVVFLLQENNECLIGNPYEILDRWVEMPNSDKSVTNPKWYGKGIWSKTRNIYKFQFTEVYRYS